MASHPPLLKMTFLGLLVAAVLCGNPGHASQESDRANLETCVAAFGRAFRDADVPALETMLSPQYIHTNSGSPPLSREQWLAYVVSRRQELASGQLRLLRYENQDLEVVLHGTTAVVTGVNLAEGARAGAPFSRRLRFTQVWVKTGDRWQRIAFHDTEAAP